MSDYAQTQKALSDIQALKEAIVRSKNKLSLTAQSIETHLVLNLVALFVSLSVIICEVLFSEISRDLIFAGSSPETRMVGMVFVGVALGALLAIAYGYLHYRARKEKIAAKDFQEKYFSYFKHSTALSDIFVKYVMFCLLLNAGQPAWIAPLFVVYLADIIVQGRVLVLTQRQALVSGAACFAIALAMFTASVSSIMVPAVIAVAASGLSLANIVSFRTKLLQGE